MQVNDLVKVKEGHPLEGNAGVIVASADGSNTVKLDLIAEPQTVADADLQFLGR